MKIKIKNRIGDVLFSGDYVDLKSAVLAAKNEDADLRDADLRDADLRGANLSGTDLRDADLRDADLRRADLRDADLSGTNLRRADLSGANLRGATTSIISKIEIKSLIKNAISSEVNGLNMGSWHTCDTVHCLAGWACVLHPEGKLLESIYGTNAAAALIFNACEGEVPNFYSTNEEAIEWLNKSNK